MTVKLHPYTQWLRESMTLPADTTSTMVDRDKLINAELIERPIPGFDLPKTLKALKIKLVPYEKGPQHDGVHGWSDETSLAITRATQYPTAVYWHELGHILLEHTMRRKAGTLENAPGECEAEMVAYLLENVYQYNEAKAKSRHYIQTWAKRGADLSKLDYPHIYGAVNLIREINQ